MSQNQKRSSDDEHEVIDQREVASTEPTRVKIKIKERLSRRKKQKLTLIVKVAVVLLASLAGYFVGSRAVTRYKHYWQRSHIEYLADKTVTGERNPLR